MPRISDEERRARIALRHRLHPEHAAPDALAATRALTVLHATEPPSVYLSLHARVPGLRREEIDRDLYEERTLVKQLAMRRTLFAFPRDLLPAAWGSAAARTAGAELRKVAGEIARAGVARDAFAWIELAVQELVDYLAEHGATDTRSLRAAVPRLETAVMYGSGKWAQEAPVGPRLMTLAGARGDIVRGPADSHWRNPRPRWTAMADWLGAAADPAAEAEGYAELVGRWLYTFGPGTEADIVWWLGATKTAVRRALADIGAVSVDLDDGSTGWVLADDTDAVGPLSDWAALLPTLDPTTMGWKARDFYLDPADRPYLFDSNGNGGTTAWFNGRIVGCWIQGEDGTVRVLPRSKLPAAATELLAAEAERLSAWFDGEIVNSIYASPMARGERLP